MPYKREGKNVYTRSGGIWKVKQHCSSVSNAKGTMRLLQGLEHGSIKPLEVGHKRKS